MRIPLIGPKVKRMDEETNGSENEYGLLQYIIGGTIGVISIAFILVPICMGV